MGLASFKRFISLLLWICCFVFLAEGFWPSLTATKSIPDWPSNLQHSDCMFQDLSSGGWHRFVHRASTRLFEKGVQTDEQGSKKLRRPTAVRVVNRALSSVFLLGDMFGQSGGKPIPDLKIESEQDHIAEDEPQYSASSSQDYFQMLQRTNQKEEQDSKLQRFPFPLRVQNDSDPVQIFMNSQRTASVHVNDSRSLQVYMTQPAEEYSVLDTSLISKMDNGTFRLSLPLDQMLGIGLVPEIDASVEIDAAKKCVTIASNQCHIWILPERQRRNRKMLSQDTFAASFSLELKWKELQDRFQRFQRFARGQNNQMAEMDRQTGLTLKRAKSRHEGCNSEGEIEGSLSVSVSFNGTSFVKLVPRRVLQKAGSLVLDALLAYLFPRFLDLLLEDYHRFLAAQSQDEANNEVNG
eukprot:CAMPEP_0117833150 /NCGR_PEP_ID=MMETSP0949-20121206/10151_1 /TAXON_ID=44440 /ORGANISM="Chattonella subsalsa, Strain CCMP2191" /LENGTH=408 /DNA_ID=CAMNT_0005674759 /DNA_START=783 /DNA_END=2009 /DNA_ORIENTATION=-